MSKSVEVTVNDKSIYLEGWKAHVFEIVFYTCLILGAANLVMSGVNLALWVFA